MQTEVTYPISASLGHADLSHTPDLNSRDLKFDDEIC
jgi:hypothetical protein